MKKQKEILKKLTELTIHEINMRKDFNKWDDLNYLEAANKAGAQVEILRWVLGL